MSSSCRLCPFGLLCDSGQMPFLLWASKFSIFKMLELGLGAQRILAESHEESQRDLTTKR